MKNIKENVAHEWTASRRRKCRIIETPGKKDMTRGEVWSPEEGIWRQWLMSTEANEILRLVKEVRKYKEKYGENL